MSRHKNQVNFNRLHKNQVNSDLYTEIKSISTSHTETKSISTTQAKIDSISMPTLKPSNFGPHTKTSNFPPPTQMPSQPPYVCKDDILTRTRHTSFLLYDGYAVHADDVNGVLILAHLPQNLRYISVVRDHQNKAQKRLDGRKQIQNKNACTPTPVRKGTVSARCDIPSLTIR